MVAEIISVGTEILLGNIVNTNAQYLSEQCAELGLSVFYQTVVGDNERRLTEVISRSLQTSDIIILTGGLGPTEDDITKEMVAKVLDKSLVPHKETEKKLRDYFEFRGWQMTSNNLKQTLIPDGSQVLENNNGTAPGILIDENNKIIIILPGPPNEMKPLWNDKVKPYLKKKSDAILESKVIKLIGIGESKVEESLLDLIQKQTNPTIAPYAKTGEVHLRLTAKASSIEEAKNLIDPIEKEISNRLGKFIYTTDTDKTLEQVVVDKLIAKKLTISTAESCTGGLLSGTITNCSGVSEVFLETIVTYSNEAKKKELGVKQATLDKFGAVSEQTAYEMAKGIVKRCNTDVGLSVTGIAGPTGGTEEKTVGLVYIGCNVKGKIVVEKFQFGGNRAKVRENSVIQAINLLRKEIMKL